MDRADEMAVFAAAANLGSFSAAGRTLRLTPSAVSKLVSRLEERLKTRLFVRTTRNLKLTPEGEVFLERARRILEDIEDAEQVVTGGGSAVAKGRLRVSASVAFGVRYVVPLVSEFLTAHPLIELELSLNDGLIDIVGERTDIAIRSGELRDTSLMARKLMESRRIIVAAPAYLARAGTPRSPDELLGHNCLTFSFRPTTEEWPFRDPKTGSHFKVAAHGNFEANNGPTVRSLCLDGLGLARVGRFHVEPDIDAGTLVPILEDFNPSDIENIHAVYPGRQHLATRIRAFIDFLVERI